MPQGHGHIANTTFAPKGAWQSDVSASKKCLGYDAFGSLLPERNYSSASFAYMFQGQEHDDELNGSPGTSYAFKYRIHDPRIGRFLSVDPLAAKYPWNSPYAFAENKVIQYVELEGLEVGTKPGSGQPEPFGGNNAVTRVIDEIYVAGRDKLNELSEWWDKADFTMSFEVGLYLESKNGENASQKITLQKATFTTQVGDPRFGQPQVNQTRANWNVTPLGAETSVVHGASARRVGVEQETTTTAQHNTQPVIKVATCVEVVGVVVERTTEIQGQTSVADGQSMVAKSTTFAGVSLDQSETFFGFLTLDAEIKIGFTDEYTPENIWR